MKYSIVIPTFNERENIITLLDKLRGLNLPEAEFIVADENSPDGTAEVVTAYAAENADVKLVLNDGQPGLSPSIVKGFSVASGDYLCCMDGDMQHLPEDAAKLLRECENGFDMIVGSRYCDDGGFAEKWSLQRTVISRTAAMIGRLALRVKLLDPMSGFFVIKRDVFNREKHLLDPRGFKIMLELYYVLVNSPRDYACREFGITFGLRQHGSSKLSLKVIFQYLFQLLTLMRRRGNIRSDKAI